MSAGVGQASIVGRLSAPPGWATRGFFALADNHGLLLRGLQADDEDLDELFHRVIQQSK